MSNRNRMFFQSHQCDGFRAKVTIEWDIPDRIDEIAISKRMADAEDIADAILTFSSRRVRDMVQAMRGYTQASS